MFAKIKNGTLLKYPYSLADLVKDNPDISFPKNISPQVLADFGVVSVHIKVKPDNYNVLSHRVVENPPREIDGVWVVEYTLVELNNESKAIALAAFKDNAIQAAQNRLDAFARTRGYDSILSATTYATTSLQKFADEGRYAVEIRSRTWDTLYSILNEITMGNRPDLITIEQVLAELPIPVWPEPVLVEE